ncbi:MAG: glycine cleavage system protein GcvH [Alphaproteobacteria bacterium]|jgi:glycine cleavage system H protein
MSKIIDGLKYTDQHEWIKLDGDIATMGITDHAQGALGDLVFVELPEVGRVVKANENFAVVESVKAASEVYAPLSGEVIEVNTALSSTPEVINTAPYEAGWICKIRISNQAEVATLMSADAYKDLAA